MTPLVKVISLSIYGRIIVPPGGCLPEQKLLSSRTSTRNSQLLIHEGFR